MVGGFPFLISRQNMPSLQLDNDTKFQVTKRLTSIGSAPTNDIVLTKKGVQPNHAVLSFDGKEFTLQTIDRKVEFEINDRRKRKATLAEGDVVQFGEASLTFRVLERAAPSAPDVDSDALILTGFQKLLSLSQKLLTNYDLPELLESMMDSVIEITNARKGFLILVDHDGMKIAVARNVNRETILDASKQLSDSIVEKTCATKKPIIVSDALNDEEFNSSLSVINLNLSSAMCVPLLDRGGLLGVIYVGNDHIAQLFTQRDLDLLMAFAGQASLIVANAIMVNNLKLKNQNLSQQLHEKRFGSIIGACDAMKSVFKTIEKVAPTSVNVLVLGETGTGKELIAHEIHQRSPRSSGPFVTINCGAIPESLLESELFGHVKGAFTGAHATREGKFQAAHHGTIFLDEIGEMPLNLQVKLLRVLQERTITKVGASLSETVDIRVIAATNRDLEEAVKRNEFREDLFYRLNVVMLRLPPLRDRATDVVLIARFLVGEICREMNVGLKDFSADAIVAMQKYPWPGNIRQLENRLKKAVVLSDRSMLSAEDLDLPPEVLTDTVSLSDAKEAFALRYILEVLERNGGNRTQTARDLDVDPRTIFRYLEKEPE